MSAVPEADVVQVLVELRRGVHGGIDARVRTVEPPRDLGDVGLAELVVLLQAVVEDTGRPAGGSGPASPV